MRHVTEADTSVQHPAAIRRLLPRPITGTGGNLRRELPRLPSATSYGHLQVSLSLPSYIG